MRRLLRSFRCGFAGLAHVVGREPNMRIHLAAAAGSLATCAWLRVAISEWMMVLAVIAFVLAAECFNTSIERLADRVTSDEDPLIQQCKDAAAAGVLVAALFALAVGGLVFLPRITDMVWSPAP